MIHDSESRRERPGFGPALRPGPAAGQAVPSPPAATPAPAPLVAPAGYRLAAPAEVLSSSGRRCFTVGRPRAGTVARRTRAAGFTHVVHYGRTSALGSAETPSLLDGASHGPAGRWLLLQRVR